MKTGIKNFPTVFTKRIFTMREKTKWRDGRVLIPRQNRQNSSLSIITLRKESESTDWDIDGYGAYACHRSFFLFTSSVPGN